MKFEYFRNREDKELSFLLKRKKKVIDLMKRLKTEAKISENKYEKMYPMIPDQVLSKDLPKFIIQLSLSILNSILFSEAAVRRCSN